MNMQTTSGIIVSRVEDKAALDRFIRLPERLHARDPAYIAPLHMEREEALSSKKNPYFTHAEAAYFIAVRDGVDVGRITAQVDFEALKLEPNVGHFGMIAAEDDPAIFSALIDAASDWLIERGMTHIRGPLNLSTNEETGLLVDGFDHPPMLLMGHDLPYVGPRLEQAGFTKIKDVVAYLYDTRGELPVAAKRLLKRAMHPSMVLRPMDWSRYDQEIRSVTEIFNDAWSGNWGFVPLTEAETAHMAKALKPLIHERLNWFVEIDGEVAGFIVALPNLNEAIRDLRGKLFPFGWLKLLWRLKVKGVKTARVPLMGVRRRHAGSLMGGLIPFLLVDAARRGSLEKGFEKMELSWILEDNTPMRRIIETLGAETYKTYRIYQKALDSKS
ncbi:dATP pyrophosphohydrolase [Lacibacterium aquatile]|uniref:dATP pyrophosphohydrolase n=1 Tax=Lacibacterium aquatile TaxID=1168082 RepID=A0ABW5DVV5_9PROT